MKLFILKSIGSMLLITPLLFTASCKKKEEAPTANFTNSIDGNKVIFTFTGKGNVDSYSWTFGDGGTSTDKSPTYTYTAAGDYTVTLKVENEGGDDSHSETITIAAAENTATNPELKFGDADGAFYAINSNTTTVTVGIEFVIKLGSAVAWFTDGTNFVDVGSVQWTQGSTTKTLDKNENNTYTWVEITQPSNGFSDDGVAFTIAGGNGFDAISSPGIMNSNAFPTIKAIDETAENINSTSDYTLSHSGSISNADSVYYSIYGTDANLLKRKGGSETSATFTAAEMATLGKGTAMMQIAGFKITPDTSTSKKIYLVNESVATKTVTIQ